MKSFFRWMENLQQVQSGQVAPIQNQSIQTMGQEDPDLPIMQNLENQLNNILDKVQNLPIAKQVKMMEFIMGKINLKKNKMVQLLNQQNPNQENPNMNQMTQQNN